MILVLHNGSKVIEVRDIEKQTEIEYLSKDTVQETLLDLAISHEESFLIWCREELASVLNEKSLADIFHHKLILASYSQNLYLPQEIGYIEESPFIKVKKDVSYPTWQTSSEVGGIHASALLQFQDLIPVKDDFDYYLNSMAKLGQQRGLFCYSEPGLLGGAKKSYPGKSPASFFTLFRFVKQHYKTRWLFLLLINLLIYQRRFLLLPFVYGLSFKKRDPLMVNLAGIKVESTKAVVKEGSLDVVIPTVGRNEFLYQVLQDLKRQTRLPSKIIIVEQNPKLGSATELALVLQQEWPFQIKHIFTHQLGVCNARNLALNEVESEWVFFNDDDNRIEENTIKQVFHNLEKFGALCCITALNNNQKEFPFPGQSTTFGSGYSFLRSDYAIRTKFSSQLEFGYGEDKDFGMQLRYSGVDIHYFPSVNVVHLNAPAGGFRSLENFPWSNSIPVPKPAPTLMWYKRKYLSQKQLLGYKTVLFLNLLKKGRLKDINRFNRSWEMSIKWSSKL